MADRDRILADFQAMTGNDDITMCIAILEEHNWNLMEAVQNAMAGLDSPASSAPASEYAPPSYASATLAAFTPPTFDEPLVGQGFRPLHPDSGSTDGGAAAAAAVEHEFFPQNLGGAVIPSTSNESRTIRLLDFKIEYRAKNISLRVPDNENVGKLKELLQSETGVPANNQQLCGWVHKNDKVISDRDVLRDLRLPKENRLFLLAPDVNNPTVVKTNAVEGGDIADMLDRLNMSFCLNINFIDKHQNFTLNFPGSKTIQEIKADLFSITNVPARHQVWTGWPDRVDDDTMTLAGSGICYPVHNLELKSNEHLSIPVQASRAPNDTISIDVDSDDEFEDASEQFNEDDDHMFDGDSEEAMSQRPKQLMPENAKDQTEALEHFSQEFASRYGECHPVFYIGRLEDAIKDALQCSARDRKLLAIYLHHDSSILANVFCSQILCAESVVAYLSNNFLTWAWDLTSEINKARLLTECTKHFGSVAANTVRNFKPDELPLLLIISRNRATNEVVQVVHGNVTLDELMTNLIHASEVFHEQQRNDIQEEMEREQRESMLREQDQAYQESLAADRLKEEQKRAEEEALQQIQMQAEAERREEELKKQEEEAEKEAIRQSVAELLPDEPASNCSEPMSTIRIRCPEGRVLTRRFLAQHPLQILLNYVTSEGFHIEDYKVITTFPRRDLSQMDAQQSLKDLKLFPQETLTLEEK